MEMLISIKCLSMFSFYTQTIIDMIPIWLAILLLAVALFRFVTWAKMIMIWRDSMLKQNEDRVLILKKPPRKT